MNKINWKDVGIRAAKTFLQTFIASLTVDGIFGITDAKGLTRFALTTGLSALAAAISAVWNVLLETLSDRAGEIVDQLGGQTAPENADAQIEDDELEEFHAEYYADDDENENDRAGEGEVG